MSPRHYFDIEYPIRFAHRGSRELWPENTWLAFDGAVEGLGYRYIRSASGDGRIFDISMPPTTSHRMVSHIRSVEPASASRGWTTRSIAIPSSA